MNEILLTKYIYKKNKIRKIITYPKNSSIRLQHEKINTYLLNNSIPSKFAKAYTKNRSIIKNARAHKNNDIFIKLDIKNFFGSINLNKMELLLFNEINTSDKNVSRRTCKEIVENCSVNNVGLPLGLINSPLLSNIYLKKFDSIIYGEIRKMEIINAIYTRYADDMVISYKGDCNSSVNKEIIKTFSKTLKKYGLSLNHDKTKIYDINKSDFVKITGINIIKKESKRYLSIGRNKKRQLYIDAINCHNSYNDGTHEKLKGKQSFYLSVEGKEQYLNFLSQEMKKYYEERGFKDFIDFVNNLNNK